MSIPASIPGRGLRRASASMRTARSTSAAGVESASGLHRDDNLPPGAMRTRLLTAALALVASAAAGCGDDPTPPRTLEGTYAAVEAINQRLPTDVFLYPSGG